jgi:carbonic anhydrase
MEPIKKTAEINTLLLNQEVISTKMLQSTYRIMLMAIMMLSSIILLGSANITDPNIKSEFGNVPWGDNYVTQTKESQSKTTPEMAIQMLKEGNARFVEDKMINRDLMEQVKQTSTGQYPIAAVVSCIDSRVPTEIVFDQGIGDIFNARIAGNFVDEVILGSLEFACKVAGSKAIVVMGHTHCGAVKGAVDDVKLGNLTEMLDNIEPAVEAVKDITEFRTSQNPEFVQKVADKHVELTIERLKRDSDILREMHENGEIAIIGAMYDVETGKVTFVD